MALTFVVARNPDPESTLPYLLRLPVDGGIELKARAPWPATARVYCHPLEEGWPEAAEVVEEVPVRSCARRGRAVDLVLDRARQNRSQFVFTEPHARRRGGRPMIFSGRPPGPHAGLARASACRPPAPPKMRRSRSRSTRASATRTSSPADASRTQRAALAIGDYAVLEGERLVAAVERKTFEDFVKSLVDGKLGFQLAELSALPAAAVVVEDRYAALAAAPRVTPGWPCELVAQLQVRYPSVPIVFADSRKLAEDWTHRYLAAAAAYHGGA